MYLKKITLENVGPIDMIEMDLPFDGENPKPLILVGENGTGKSHLISYIFDAIFEFHKVYFKNISNKENAYFRFSGGNNTTYGKEYLLAHLSFEYDGERIEYIDKNGTITLDDAKRKLSTAFEDINGLGDFGNSYFKSTTEKGNNKSLEKDFQMNTYCYFPANRSEVPHWLNSDALKDESFHMKDFLSGVLEKDIILETSLQKNKKWLLDVVLDYLNSKENILGEDNINLTLWTTVNQILRYIFGEDILRLGIGGRNNFSRISVVKDTNEGVRTFLPSINCLSQGQAVLFNLFVSIIKLSDSNPKPLNQIIGIVIIDEIDLHLHSNLQKEVLPKLIQLFPKIQFIITTHSPLFVLGMEQTLGQDKVEIREMPTGNRITAERFKEFEKAFEYFTETKKYEESLSQQVQSQTKPIIYVEGPTDIKYLKKGAELLEKTDILNRFDLRIVGEETSEGTKNCNDKALKDAGIFLSTNLNLIKSKIIILHDPENPVTEANHEDKLYIRKMQRHSEGLIEKGIESLFHKNLINKGVNEHIEYFEIYKKNTGGTMHEETKIIQGTKSQLCDWICNNTTKEDFLGFEHIFSELDGIHLVSTPVITE